MVMLFQEADSDDQSDIDTVVIDNTCPTDGYRCWTMVLWSDGKNPGSSWCSLLLIVLTATSRCTNWYWKFRICLPDFFLNTQKILSNNWQDPSRGPKVPQPKDERSKPLSGLFFCGLHIDIFFGISFDRMTVGLITSCVVVPCKAQPTTVTGESRIWGGGACVYREESWAEVGEGRGELAFTGTLALLIHCSAREIAYWALILSSHINFPKAKVDAVPHRL